MQTNIFIYSKFNPYFILSKELTQFYNKKKSGKYDYVFLLFDKDDSKFETLHFRKVF